MISELQETFSFLGTRETRKIFLLDESFVYTTIAYVQYTIGLRLDLLKRYIDIVTESGIQAIKLSGDVEK